MVICTVSRLTQEIKQTCIKKAPQECEAATGLNI